MKTLNKTLIAAALLTTGAAAQAEVSGGAAIASSYLWRGFDLSAGSAVVSGSLDYSSEVGIYAGIWGSSGDDTYGTEYDLYVGYAGEAGDIGYDIGFVSYNYPSCDLDGDGTVVTGDCNFEEIYASLSYGAFGATVYNNGDADYNDTYIALGYDFADFSFTYGMWSDDGAHLDATYSMGDLAFTLSQAFDDAVYSEETQFVVSYSIPLEM